MKKQQISKSFPLLLVTFLALAAVTALAAVREVSLVEQFIFEAVYELTAPVLLLMQVVTQLGGLPMLLLSGLVAFAAGRRNLAAQLWLAGGFAFAVSMILKSIISRPRPFELLQSVTQHDLLATGFGYPSGHTAIAVSLTVILYQVFPKQYRWILIALAVLVGLSRMSLGVHAPLDVVGGALIGLLSAQLVLKEFPGLKNKS